MSQLSMTADWNETIASDLQDLRLSSLRTLCLFAMSAAWVWLLILGLLYSGIPPAGFLLPPVILVTLSLLAYLAQPLPQTLRSLLLLLGLSAGLFVGMLRVPALNWGYFQALVVVIASLLSDSRLSLAVSVLLTAGLVFLSTSGLIPLGLDDLVFPLLLIWCAAVVAVLSSASLRTALEWALDSQRRAWVHTKELRERRAELKSLLDSLQRTYQLLERTNHELDLARLDAEEAYKGKSRFVANISHEFRTPLNIIVGFAEMLCTSPESYGDYDWPAALRQDLSTIWRNAEHLLKMVDDVLDLAQIQVSRLPVFPEPTHLSDLVAETLDLAKPLVSGSTVSLCAAIPEGLPELRLDRTRVRQVLLNLINNAIRHTAKGTIEIGARVDGEEIVVYVRDTGEGIPADKLERIFLEFEQADTSFRRPYQGAGLGLAISRHLISLHGGRMWAESVLGQGSTFLFTLPTPAALATTQLSRLRRTQDAGHRATRDADAIVAICSDALAVRLLERYMERRVLLAATPTEAVTLIQNEHPQALVIMPESYSELEQARQNALEVLQAVSPYDLPVVTCCLPTERRASGALHVPELLIKPVVREQVVSVVERLCPRPQRVLVVDDDRDMVALLRRILESQWSDMEVLVATRGAEALRQAQHRPDVILLDLLMPEMSGSELLELLRADERTAHIPVAVITARGPAEDLATQQMGELHLFRNTGFAAEELIRVLESTVRNLPPHYVTALVGAPSTLETAPA
jgi:signal transduction histidine kinase/CheY-like chemotaxis protein